MIDLLRSAIPLDLHPELAEAVRRPWIMNQINAGMGEARRAPDYATPNLARWFRKNRSLGSRDRRVVAEAVHGLIRHEALLLRAGARSPDELVLRWADMMDGDRFDHLEATSPTEDFATALNVPGPIAQEWLNTLEPEGAAEFAQAINRRPAVHIRTNLQRTDRTNLMAALAGEGVTTSPFPGSDTALTVEGRANLQATSAFRGGLFEVQDASSQLFVDALPIQSGEHVLDLCAGAGGKSLAMAALGAKVHATDIRSNALAELEKRAARAGATIDIAQPSLAPLVVVDAPCSGSGRLRRNPALRWGLSDAVHLSTQAELVAAATEFVAPDGVLAYATCSLLCRENSPPTPNGWHIISEQTLWPHVHNTDGFYWRLMARR